MSLNERIAEIIEYSKLSASEFADAVEVQRSSISHITSGRNKPSLDFIIKVKNYLPQLEWDWLIKGEGDMLTSDKTAEEETEAKAKPTSLPDLFSLIDRKSTRLNSSHVKISYAVFCLKKKRTTHQ